MSSEIFISYRRTDTGGYAGRLYDHLKQEFGPDSVLLDVEVEGTAEELRQWVQRVVPEAGVMLVLIGHKWILSEDGRRRLEEPEDIVRLEIELALLHDLPIIPIQIDDAPRPTHVDLPDSIRKIMDFKGYDLNNSYWGAKVEPIFQAIMSVVKHHTHILNRGVEAWNAWRAQNPELIPNLAHAKLSGKDLTGVELSNADLQEADLSDAILYNSNLRGARLSGASLKNANLAGANLREVDLSYASLNRTNLCNACLENTDLRHAVLNEADLANALIKSSDVFGVSVWGAKLGGAIQSDLRLSVIGSDRSITVDSIQTAVVVHLLLTSGGARELIDSITAKIVLILGRFTPERKAVLDSIVSELPSRNYVPILFDFEKPRGRSLLETITTLAHMARFIIADLTDTKTVSMELVRIVPFLPSVPVVTIIEKGWHIDSEVSELLRTYHWVLKPYEYENRDALIASLEKHLIDPAQAKISQLAQTAIDSPLRS
jgi:uncharacterized protein YjbI with pentapeptide repeats